MTSADFGAPRRAALASRRRVISGALLQEGVANGSLVHRVPGMADGDRHYAHRTHDWTAHVCAYVYARLRSDMKPKLQIGRVAILMRIIAFQEGPNVLLEGVPKSSSIAGVKQSCMPCPAFDAHDLHASAISSRKTAITSKHLI
jgi:hypothetical protein